MSAGFALESVRGGRLARLAADEPVVEVSGDVIADPTVKDGAQSLVLRVTHVADPDRFRTDELLKVIVKESPRPVLLGDRLCLGGRLRPPKGGPNGEYALQLARRGIGAVLITYPDSIDHLPPSNALLGWIYRFRADTGLRIDRVMDADAAAVTRGILLGDRARISDELNDDFKRSGLAHILAVSGLHVVLLAGCVLALARAVRMGARSQRLFVVSIVVAYSVLTGSPASVLRAMLMALVATAAWMLGRRQEIGALMAVTALGLLGYNPLYLFDIGFQLSFGAVVSLVLFGSRVESHLEFLPGWIRTSVAATISAQLGAAPLLVIYFNQMSLVAPLANIATVGPSGIALAIGLGGGVLWPLVPALGGLLLRICGWIMAYIVAVTRLCSGLPLASILVPTPSLAAVAAYYVGLWWCLSVHRMSGRARRLVPVTVGAAVLLLACAAAGGGLTRPTFEPHLRLIFLDVGQGDAALILAGDKIALIDGGPNASVLTRRLADRHITRIDLLLITHAHDDHVAGLERLGATLPVGTVMVGRGTRLTGRFREVVARLRRRGARLRLAGRGSVIALGGGVRLRVLFPDGNPVRGSQSDSNNNSLVARLTYGRFSALLPGDLESEGESAVLRRLRRGGLRADVYKIPHHGSKRGASARFIRAVDPAIAVISVGKDNTFGHPAPSTLRRLAGAMVYRTDLQGTIEVASDGQAQSVVAER